MEAKNLYDFTVKNKKGESVSLAEYKGKVVLIVNIATKCGLFLNKKSLNRTSLLRLNKNWC